MEVQLAIPRGANIGPVLDEYPDLYKDDEDDEMEIYWIGNSGDDWLTYDDAVAFCGFCEGAIPNADARLEGDGGWEGSMIRRKDFSGFAVDEETKKGWKRVSDIYWKAYAKGKEVRK